MRLTDFDSLVPKGSRFQFAKPNYDEEKWWNGRLLIWEGPLRGYTYAMGVDCAEGVGKDRSVVSVIKIGNKGEPDTQVAEFASDWHGAAAMAPIVSAIGRFYSDSENLEAIVTIEGNMLGQVCIQDLRTAHGYSHFYIRRMYDRYENIWVDKLGFVTNRQSRPALISRGLHAMQEGHLVPASEFLLQEMEDFEGDWNLAQARAKSGQHDDRVIAFKMAYWGAHEEEWLAGEDPIEEFARLTVAGQIEKAEEKVTGRKADWQNTAITYEEMMAASDEEMFG